MTVTENIAAPFDLPDSAVAEAARRLSEEVSPAFVYNHTVRSYLFGRELAAAGGTGNDHDDELLFLACVLHDLGVTDYAIGDQRFEVEGADAAARFLREAGVEDDRVKTVWNAIALHTSPGLAQGFGVIEGLAQRGIAADIAGLGREQLRPEFAERVHAAWPRHDIGYALPAVIARQVHEHPAKGLPWTVPDHAHRRFDPATGSLDWFDIVQAGGWGDRPTAVNA